MNKVLTHLLHLFGIHQRIPHYIPLHDYLTGPSNPVADALSQELDLAWGKLMGTLESHFLSGLGYHILEISSKFAKVVLMALMQKHQSPECLIIEPSPTQKQAPGLVVDKIEWLSIPTSKPPCVQYSTYKKANNGLLWEEYHAHRIPSGLDRFKVK